MDAIDRRKLLLATAAALIFTSAGRALGRGVAAKVQPFRPLSGARARVIFVNDLSGDVDGLFATVHQILSPSTDLRAIVGTATGRAGETAEESARLATEILDLMDLRGSIPVYAGAAPRMTDKQTPVMSAGSKAIIDEAMRSDTDLPLYVAVGGGLTEVASALLIEP